MDKSKPFDEGKCGFAGTKGAHPIGDRPVSAKADQPRYSCYAPVFEPSNPFVCLIMAIIYALVLLALFVVLIFSLGSQGVLCAIRQILFRIKHCGDGNSDPDIDLNDPYGRHVHTWRINYGKDAAWEQWMLDNRNRYEAVYFRAAARPSTPIMAFRYNTAPIGYNPAWTSETEHMTALVTFMGLVYVGYGFQFAFGGDTTSSYANVIAGIPVNSSYASGKDIYLYYETIINHEFAHVMAVPHHYDTDADIGNGQHMPPGESVCLMDRTLTQFCSGCRTALMIPLGVDNSSEIMAAGANISTRYPY